MRLLNRRRNRESSSNNVAPSLQSSSSPLSGFDRQAAELIPAEVRMISGCHTEQTSADVSNVTGKLPDAAGRAGGACTSALLNILYKRNNKNLTFQQLLLELRQELGKDGYSQIPQLTSSRPLDVKETPFSLVGDDAGTKRALLVGINYRGQSGQLSGCQNDVLNMKKYLIEKQGYTEHNILVIMDDGIHHFPTRQTMIAGLRKLVEHSSPGDSVYFHYSGHGGLLMPQGNAFKNSTKDVDETLIPLDHERSGHIRDFSLFNHFVKPMASGVTVTCVMDCCHSGAVLNLPYSFQPTSAGTIRSMQNMSSLTNLAFLYILAGGLLPHHGFESIVNNIEETTGGDVSDYQGAGMDDAAEQDGFDYAQDDGYQDTAVQDTIDDGGGGVDYGDAGAGDMGEGQVVDGEVVGQDMYPDDSYAGAGFNSGDDGGFGDAAGFGDTDYGNIAGDDVDCGCFQDVLGALLESDF